MKRLAALTLGLLLATSAHADFIASGFFVSGFIETGFFETSTPQVAVPNVVGQANAAAADAILEGDGLDLGVDTETCSAAANNEIVGQDPIPGTLVDLGSLVNVVSSNGIECINSGRKGISSRSLTPFF